MNTNMKHANDETTDRAESPPVQPARESDTDDADGVEQGAPEATETPAALPREGNESLEASGSPITIPIGVLNNVDPRYIKTESVGLWIGTAIQFILGAIPLSILWFKGVGPTWLRLLLLGIWGGILLLLIFLCIWYPVREYRRTKYRITPTGMEIHKGVVWHQVINVPRNRVQHTDVTQGPLLRLFGLATLTIHTAGTMHSTVTLNGVTLEIALHLRDLLIRREGGPDE